MILKITTKKLILIILILTFLITLLFYIKKDFKSSKYSNLSSPPLKENASTKKISVVAKQFSFSPNTIKVSYGDTVNIKIKSVDVTHGIALPDFGINEVLEPGKEVNITFKADKKGSFSFFCSIACGEGHSGMRGLLIVE